MAYAKTTLDEAALPEGTGLGQRWRHWDKTSIVWLVAIAILVLLVVNPLLRLLVVSFQDGNGAFTLANYIGAYGRSRHIEALLNSLILGVSAGTLCLLFGVPMAWALSRTDMPCKGLVWIAILGTFIIPPYLGAVGWILLAGPNAGWLNKAVVALTGADKGPFNIYSMPGLVLVVACYSFPYVFVLTKSALDLVSSEMEDAANILGAGHLRTTFLITLPLVLPAILGAFILVFLEAIALFGSPALLALPGRFHVVTTQLWQFFEFPPRVGLAAAYAMPLLVITILLFWLQRRITNRKGYVSLTGKGGERRSITLGPWKWAMLAWCVFVTTLSFFMPLVVICQAAFAKAWGRGWSLDNLTLRNVYAIVFENALTRTATWHTFLYAGTASLIALVLALCIAYITNRNLVNRHVGSALGFLTMAPFVVPGIVLAIGFYAAYTHPPLLLYGTAWILILAFTTRFLPIAFVNSNAAIRSINPELEEAVRTLGGSRLTAIRHVVLPVLKRSMAGAFILVFIPATRELSTAIFLYSINTQVLSVLLFDKSDEGNFETLASIGLVLVVITVALILAGFRLMGRDFMLRRTVA
ncbi:ABC transporter permease [Ramlibacter alkalitolerans]|uniref:Iron ABC transporter permease n=1 Tax=Ramlibacter alkalitolerans TaxID=2039631 RepID=A0ABS1JUZ4_9BURK|nr:iron ABC transporter permease [Ramlibacter alkalitolerans]MBL0428110.1 iron ABC transporter permease [Ramlibacter alkalitolerans]